jgi:hypothetical protein
LELPVSLGGDVNKGVLDHFDLEKNLFIQAERAQRKPVFVKLLPGVKALRQVVVA